MTTVWQKKLTNGLEILKISYTDKQLNQLTTYLELLQQWNAVYNLTAIRDPLEMVTKHILDSLTILPFISGQSTADLGSGAGLPGVPLAILKPDIKIYLIESNSKKSRFLKEVARQLQLTHVTVITERAENPPPECVTTVTARALAPLATLIHWAKPWLAQNGVLLAMKGPNYKTELTSLKNIDQYHITSHQLQVPYIDAQRFIVIVKVKN